MTMHKSTPKSPWPGPTAGTMGTYRAAITKSSWEEGRWQTAGDKAAIGFASLLFAGNILMSHTQGKIQPNSTLWSFARAWAWRLQWHPCRQRCSLWHWAWQQGVSTSSCPEDMCLLFSRAPAGDGGEQFVAVEALHCANLTPWECPAIDKHVSMHLPCALSLLSDAATWSSLLLGGRGVRPPRCCASVRCSCDHQPIISSNYSSWQ